AAREHVDGVRQRVRDADVTTRRIAETVGGWTARTASERLAARRGLDRAAGAVGERLRTAELWLGAATSAVGKGRRLLDVAERLGATADATAFDELQATLSAVRDRVAQAAQTADEVRDALSGDDGDLSADRLARLAKLLAAVAVAVGDVDTR